MNQNCICSCCLAEWTFVNRLGRDTWTLATLMRMNDDDDDDDEAKNVLHFFFKSTDMKFS